MYLEKESGGIRLDNKVEKMKNYSALGSWAIWESNRNDGDFIQEADLVEDIDFIKYENQLQKSCWLNFSNNYQ